MKNSKYCEMSSCCKDHRHEVFGIILLVIATILTIASQNSFGIIAMFLAGLVLCCYKRIPFHICNTHCHCPCVEAGEKMDKSCDAPAKKPAKSKA